MEPVNESTSGSLKWLVLPTLTAEVVLSGIMLGCYARRTARGSPA